jgi:UDP-N-acetylglucosamine:LPS N-acetylglucosamine transferase
MPTPTAPTPTATKKSAQKILLLSVSAGAGHVRAAQAISACAAATHPGATVTHWDVMDYVPTSFKKLYTDFYIKLVNKAPALWGYLYHSSDAATPDSLMEKLRRQLERMNTSALRKAITQFALDTSFQLMVLAGKNAQALAALQQLAKQYPGRIFPQGFTNQVERLMACADWVVTKPGGLTTSECLAMGLPMIVNSPIPGQEERNADYLLEQGVALKASDDVTLAYRVRHLLTHPEQLQDMQRKARHLGRPNAAAQVLAIVMQS